jgi:hypothetical protein
MAFSGSIAAQAADLGTDCCTDLEQRIAELEATTARKGNRKVSITISGFVNEAVMWWDDGEERNTYVVTNDSGRTRVRFRGKAEIDKDWEAGYRLEFGVRSARSDRVDQGGPFGDLGSQSTGPTLDIRYSLWYLKSKTLGEVLIGRTESASQNITEVNVTQTADIVRNSDVEDWAAGFQLVAANIPGARGLSAIEWRRLVNDDFIQPGEGDRFQAIQYVSPQFHGLWLEASWGQDDYWDVGLWYEGEKHGIKLEAGIAYSVNSDGDTADANTCIVTSEDNFITGSSDDADCRQLGGSISALHEPSGLFLTFGAGWFRDSLINESAVFADTGAADTSTYYAFQTGVERKWHPLGKTTVYGEWFQYFGGANDRTVPVGDSLNTQIGFGASNIWDDEVRVYGTGVIQGVDAAAMRLYLGWRHYEADLLLREQTTGDIASSPLKDLDVVMGGALIEF